MLLEMADVQQQGYAVGYQFYASEKDNTAWWVKMYAKNVGNLIVSRCSNCWLHVTHPHPTHSISETIPLTWPTMELISPVFSGSRRVLLVLARLEKAWTYCSATAREAALEPCCRIKERSSLFVSTSSVHIPSPMCVIHSLHTAALFQKCISNLQLCAHKLYSSY